MRVLASFVRLSLFSSSVERCCVQGFASNKEQALCTIGISPLPLPHTFPKKSIDLCIDQCVDTARQLLLDTFPHTVNSGTGSCVASTMRSSSRDAFASHPTPTPPQHNSARQRHSDLRHMGRDERCQKMGSVMPPLAYTWISTYIEVYFKRYNCFIISYIYIFPIRWFIQCSFHKKRWWMVIRVLGEVRERDFPTRIFAIQGGLVERLSKESPFWLFLVCFV